MRARRRSDVSIWNKKKQGGGALSRPAARNGAKDMNTDMCGKMMRAGAR